ncbi:MAG: M20/M25/M40 family metallo-hydrolase [Bdellovibrionales bacterium]
MNKLLIGLLALGVTSSIQAAKSPTAYAVKTKHLNSFNQTNSKNKIETITADKDSGYSVVVLNEKQVMDVTTHVHTVEKNCGGLEDLSVDASHNNFSIMQSFKQMLKEPTFEKFDYSIKNDLAVREVLTHLSKANYEGDLRIFTSFKNRFANSQLGVDAAHWLRDKARTYASSYGRNDVEVSLLDTPRYKQPSVLVKIPGSVSSLPGVLIGGHMDSYSGNKPAVDDDASGTIASLEVLRGLLASEQRFKRDIYVAFYAAEEWGLHGSKRMANQFRQDGIKLKGIMQLDMIAYSQETDKHFTFVRDFTNDKLTEYTMDLAKHYLGTTSDKIGNTRCGYGCSDHASWHRNSYPAVTPFEAHMDGMNGALHTPRDTMDLADIEHAFRFVQLGMAFIAETAEPTTIQ